MLAKTTFRCKILTLPVFGGVFLLWMAGCASTSHVRPVVHPSLPKETAKTSPLMEYDIGISDVLVVEAVRMVPKSPYHLQPFDGVSIMGYGEDLEDYNINTVCRIQPNGVIALPPPVGNIKVTGLTCEEVSEMILQKISDDIGRVDMSVVGVSVTLEAVSGLQPVSGEHTVGADGRINLGIYGSVHVAGLTLAEAKEAIEFQLVEYLDSPNIAVDVYSYNSKRYYVVMEGAGFGDRLIGFPYTGNETVLDAIAGINGMDRVSSKRVWIARSSPYGYGYHGSNILVVDWKGITAEAAYCTNYQLMPNDRIFIEEDKMVAWDTKLSKVIAPFERVMGFSLLGAQTVTRFSGDVLRGGGDPSGGRGGY
jgi:polysaccharide export outer membrane protein